MPVLLTPYLKWGHRKNRQLLTCLLLISMLISIGIQGWNLLNTITQSKPQPQKQDNQLVEKPKDNPKAKDLKFLFGVNHRPEKKSESTDIPKTRLSLVLRGALAGLQNKKYASAIIQGGNQDKLYEVGDALPGGAILSAVFSDHVVLNRGGQLETLYFPDTSKDSRAIQEYKPPEPIKSGEDRHSSYNQSPESKSLENRMQDLRERLQQSSQ